MFSIIYAETTKQLHDCIFSTPIFAPLLWPTCYIIVDDAIFSHFYPLFARFPGRSSKKCLFFSSTIPSRPPPSLSSPTPFTRQKSTIFSWKNFPSPFRQLPSGSATRCCWRHRCRTPHEAISEPKKFLRNDAIFIKNSPLHRLRNFPKMS